MTGDAWTHPNSKEWTITFEMAQAYGWQPPLRTRSHPNYILECPIRDPRCKIRAYGTSNADEPARTARRKIRQCQHVPEGLFRQARRHVAEGEQLIKIVEAQVLVETSRAEVEVYISDLESTIDAADAKIEAFVEADDRHKRLEEELRLIVSDRGRMGELRDNQSKAKDDEPAVGQAVVESSCSRLLVDVIRGAWDHLGFDVIDDEAFFQLVLAALHKRGCSG